MSAAKPAPRVSVLMTTWNGAGWIRQSIDSILAQTFRDFELIVVDDASTDGTPGILAACDDPRLRVLRTDTNLGVVGARNLGFTSVRGTYLAALDHDDLARPERLAVQVAYLDAHPRAVLVGSEVLLAHKDRLDPTDHYPGMSPMLLRWMLHVDNPLTWSSVMARMSAIRETGAFVRPEYELADDFDLYHRLLPLGDIARLDQTLVIYRWHDANLSRGRETVLRANAVKVLTATYRDWLGDDAPAAAALVARHLNERRVPRDLPTLRQLGSTLERLLGAFLATHHPDPADQAAIAAHAGRVWWRCCGGAARKGHPSMADEYWRRPALAAGYKPTRREIAETRAVSLLRAAGRRIGLPTR